VARRTAVQRAARAGLLRDDAAHIAHGRTPLARGGPLQREMGALTEPTLTSTICYGGDGGSAREETRKMSKGARLSPLARARASREPVRHDSERSA
jgi:hypothetical protein